MSETVVYNGRIFNVVKQPVGSHQYNVVKHPGSVFIIPFISDERILMIRQFRPVINEWVWEIPAGTRDVPGESDEACARRELEEETGYRAGRMERLCDKYASYGYCTENSVFFAAYDLTQTQTDLQGEEQIETHEKTIQEAVEMIYNGEVKSALVAYAILHLICGLLRGKSESGHIQRDQTRCDTPATTAVPV